MDLVINAGVPLSVIIHSLSIFNMLFIFDRSMSCNSCRGPVRQERGITSQNKNLSGIEQLSVLSFYKIQMSLSERAVPSGDSSSSLLSNADYPPPSRFLPHLPPPHWGITSWEEADGIQSMKRWQDWATRVWTSEDLLFLLCASHKFSQLIFFLKCLQLRP